jgi:hypothetical protein
MLGADHPVMQHCITEEWNPQLHHCENLKACRPQNVYVHADVTFQQNIRVKKMQQEIEFIKLLM